MFTLIRPETSSLSDEIQNRLNKMFTAYEVLYKEISTMPYLIESGRVISGKDIHDFLDDFQDEIQPPRHQTDADFE